MRLRCAVVSELARQASWIEVLSAAKHFEEVVALSPDASIDTVCSTETERRTVVIGDSAGGDAVLRWAHTRKQGVFGLAVVAPTSWPESRMPLANNFVLAFCRDEKEASLAEAVYPRGVEIVTHGVTPAVVSSTLDRVCAAPRSQPSGQTTILGIGSLLSEASARTTFPDLENFRLVRIRGWRRVFAHAAAIFFERGIANRETLEFASLSAEAVPSQVGFVASAFEVEINDDADWHKFLEREEEFDLVDVEYENLDGLTGTGVLCSRSSDEAFIARWGRHRYNSKYKGVAESIWNYKPDSGLRPCAVYLRHCVLAVQKAGMLAYNSFLDETFLIDRQTTLRTYLAAHPYIMDTRPPPSLADRYSG